MIAAPPTDDAGSFVAELYRGRLRWDLMRPFPRQDAADRRTGDLAVEEAARFVRETVDPTAVDETRTLPDGLLDELRRRRYTALQPTPALGGLGLSALNAFRLIEGVAQWATSIAYVLAIQNGLGAVGYLPFLAPGPLRDLVERHVAAGSYFADADTEAAGAANHSRGTVATPVEGGRAYSISGEKVFIGNGSIADLLTVAATVRGGDREAVRTFFVEARTPGFQVRADHDMIGLHGFPLAALRLEGVRVPAEHMLTTADDAWRLSPVLSAVWTYGRLLTIATTSLALGRLCLRWSRDFVRRRAVDGRSLGGYEAIQRIVSLSLADLFAMESVVEWCLLGCGGAGAIALRFEQAAAKNITSLICWRIVERTMSLVAAEGAESAPSKVRRGAPGLPLERAFRDARLFRIAGGVDFHVDNWLTRTRMLPFYYWPSAAPGPVPDPPDGDGLLPVNRAHLRAVARRVDAMAAKCRSLARRHPDPAELFERERTLVLLGRIADELFTMSAVLARTADGPHVPGAQALADVYCTAARHRLAAWNRELREARRPDWVGTSDAWLRDVDPAAAGDS